MNNGNANPWTKVSDASNNERFEPHKHENLNDGYPKFLEGYYVKTRDILGSDNKYFKSHEVAVVNPNGNLGKHFDVNGGVSLDKKLEAVPLGSYIRIEYLGRVPSKHPGRNPFKNWEVYKANGVKPIEQMVQDPIDNNPTKAPAPPVAATPAFVPGTPPTPPVPPAPPAAPANPFGTFPTSGVPFA